MDQIILVWVVVIFFLTFACFAMTIFKIDSLDKKYEKAIRELKKLIRRNEDDMK